MSKPHIPDGADEFRAAHELRAADDGNRLVGYAAVFNQDTTINSWEGHFNERIMPGAFSRTIKARGDKVKVLFNHGQDPSLGDMPLGKPDVIREDDHGLYVEVPLSDTDYNRERIKPLLRDGALDGMSFRFSVTKEEWDEDADPLPVRTIKELKLFEFGPVTFPAYDNTNVGLRSDPRFDALRHQLTPEDSPTPQVLVVEREPASGTSPDDPPSVHSSTEDEDRAAYWRDRSALIANRSRFLPDTRKR